MTQFASATFDGADGAELAAVDANWGKFAGSTIDVVLASGRASEASTGITAYYHKTAPPSADYSVSADVYRAGLGTSGVVARATGTATATMYLLRYNVGSQILQMYRGVNNLFTQLGGNVSASLAAGATARITLEVSGSTIKAYWNGGGTPVLTITDTAITAAGYSGIRWNTAGLDLDNFSADSAGASLSAGVSEAAGLTDGATAAASWLVSAAEVAALDDALGAVLFGACDLVESATLVEAAAASGAEVPAALEEAAALSDGISGALQIAADMLEAVAAGDIASALLAAAALQAEAASLGDGVTPELLAGAAVMEQVAAGDDVAGNLPQQIAAALGEGVTLADILALKGIMITSAQAREYLDTALGITVPGFILTTAVARLNSIEDQLEAAGYDEPTLMLIQCMCVALIAASGAPRRTASQGAPSGASRSFRYTDGDLSALRRSLAELDTAGVTAGIIGADPAAAGLLMIVC